MKKCMSSILALALVLSLILAGGWNGSALAEVPEERVGTYEIVELYMEGVDYTETMKTSGMTFTLVLYADGSAVLSNGERDFTFAWNEKNFDYGDSKSPYTYENGKLTLEEDDMVMVFQQRSKDTQAAPQKAEPAELTGTWIGVADMRGTFVEAVPDIAPYLTLLPVSVVMEMRTDGTYTCTMDPSLAEPVLKEAMRAYVLDLCEKNNTTVEQFEQNQGKTMDEYLDEAIAEMNLSGSANSITGKYTEKDGKVTWDPGAGETLGLFTGDLLTFSLEGFGDVVLSRGEITGTWIAMLNMKDTIVQTDPEWAEALSSVPIIPLYVVLEMKADGSYTMRMDASAIVPALREAMRAYIEEVCKQSNITQEQFEEQAGMSVDEVLAAATDGMDLSSVNEKTLEGTYTLNGSDLTLDPGQQETVVAFGAGLIVIPMDEQGELLFTRAGFLGEWSGKLYLVDLIELDEEDEEMAAFMKDVSVDVTVELRADGTYSLTSDASYVLPAVKTALRAYLDQMCKTNNITPEQLEQSVGMPIDQYLDQIIAGMDVSEMNVTAEGSYSVQNGKIVFDEEQSGMLSGMWFGNTLILPLDETGNIVFTRK